MSPWKAAHPGDAFEDIDTPALVLDLDAFERNLSSMQKALASSTMRLRPHAKSHKCPEIALRQIKLGAVGICCQKVSEAARFVEAGVADVLITNQVVGLKKIGHALDLAERARVGVLVDHPDQVTQLAQASGARQVMLDVYIEVDVGAGRCGVSQVEEVTALAEQIDAAPYLRFMGLQCYHGSAQHYRKPEERQAAIASASSIASKMRTAIEKLGIKVERITGAGTGSVVLERDSGVFNEIQAGSYIFMDGDYAKNESGPRDIRFEHALFVKTAVLSRPTAERAVVDAGLKASSVDSGVPIVWQLPGVQYTKASDEHGVLQTAKANVPALGDSLLLVPGHCDPTVNLYDELICYRNGKVEEVWPIAARGAAL
ncbi:DSD1 family PLP-dependent enzyme [Zwartia sp.]|uniref:DSD1 family PLP-dependent enzyme n=1 Tax=Zwartia sp. TaxID=2978004 RepID=UPI002729024F|nr:DSD1 family PLP-dependent enzyme [Zwartia sp.]MDO9024255.1 DSD1 family PLP-dependent enzyme [Zwartia sp.]